MKRPLSIIGFEIASYVYLAINAFLSAQLFDRDALFLRANNMDPTPVAAMIVVAYAAFLLIVWLAAYKASNICRFLGVISIILMNFKPRDLNVISSFIDLGDKLLTPYITATILGAVVSVLLFVGDSNSWFRKDRD